MGTIKDLKFWSYKVLPLAYDDSLSYYEVVDKVAAKLNEVIGVTNDLPENISAEIKKQLAGGGDVFDNLFNGLINAIATKEGDEVTFTPNEKQGGEIIWLGDTLYEVVVPMQAGVNYIVGTNIVPVDVDGELNKIKGYISANNEYFHERAVSNHDTQTYLFWKDKLYRVDADIKVNDILSERVTVDGNTTGQLTLVNVMDEVTKHYLEMHDADNTLQTQIDGNDGDIEDLQHKNNDLQTQITSNNQYVNNRIDNISAQAGTDNTEIVDARTTSQKEGGETLASLKARIDRLAYESILSGKGDNHFINSENDAKALLGDTPDILNLPKNTIYQFGYSSNTGNITNLPFNTWSPFIIANLSYSFDGNTWVLYILKVFNSSNTPYFGVKKDTNTITWVSALDEISNAATNFVKTGVTINNSNLNEILGETPDYKNLEANKAYNIDNLVTTEIANEPQGLSGTHRIVTKINNSNGYYTYLVKHIPVGDNYGQNKPINFAFIGSQSPDGNVWWNYLPYNVLKGGWGDVNFVNSEDDAKRYLGDELQIKNMPSNIILQFNATSVTGQINGLPFNHASLPYSIVSLGYSTGLNWKVYLLTTFTKPVNFYVGVTANTDNVYWRKMNEDITPQINKQIESYLAESYKIFLKVGCIGDSYTSGWLRNANQYNPNYAWPKFMAKDSGNEYVNFGHSGATAKSWMTTAEHTKAETDKCQCYLIGLGINDVNQGVPVGTIDDCENADADTYYRNMYVVINFAHTLVPDAPIFVQTRGNVDNDYNAAVRAICAKYHDTMHTHCLDLYAYNYLYNQSAITNNAYGGHYHAAGYANLAKLLERVWSYYIDTHASEFGEIDLIDYGQ